MYEHGLQEACLRPRSRRGNLAPGGRLAMAALLVLLAACPAPPPPPPPAVRPTPVRSAPAPLPDAQRVQALEQELAQLAGPVPASAERAYAWLAQRARDGDHGARTVQLVFGLRGALRTGCRDAQEKEGFAQQLALLRLHLGSGTAAERVFAGPTLLMGLKETGQQEEVLSGAFELAALTRDVYQKHPQRLGALLFDITHVLRRACHLKPALSLLEEAQPLLLGDPGRPPRRRARPAPRPGHAALPLRRRAARAGGTGAPGGRAAEGQPRRGHAGQHDGGAARGGGGAEGAPRRG